MSSPLFPLREDPGGLYPAAKAGTGPRLAPSGDQLQSAGAWKREMEQAQRDTWFKPGQAAARAEGRPEGVAGPFRLDPVRPHPALSNRAVRADRRVAESGPPAPRPMSNRSPGIPAPARAPRPEAGRLPATDIRLASLALALAGVSRLKVTGLRPSVDADELTADALPAPMGPTPQSEGDNPDPQAIRLHAEWHGPDVVVWLGIDARAEAGEAQVAQLLTQIRACLQEQRSRLSRLVCNGKTVFEIPSFSVSTLSYFTPPKELS